MDEATRIAALLDALDAVVARIDGVFDSAALLACGPLSTDTTADVRRIASEAIGANE